MEIDNFNWKKYLVECLESTEFCCLATIDAELGTWTSPVYFAWDEWFNLYFVSQPPSRHMQNLVKDKRMAVAIYSTKQSTFGDVIGIQLYGDAQLLTSKDDVYKAYASYYGRKYPNTGRNAKGKNEEAYMNNPDWMFVKISPKNIEYFDTRVFGEERQSVPREIFATTGL